MSLDNKNINGSTLIRFLTGDLDSEDRQRVITWLNESDDNRKRFDSVEAVWVETGKLNPQPIAVDSDKAWRRMSDKIQMQVEIDKVKSRGRSLYDVRKVRTIWGSIAAVLVVVIGIIGIVTSQMFPETVMYSNKGDGIISDTIPDGSVITLNSGAVIQYAENEKQERVVTLRGEACFDVVKAKEKPFIVNTDAGGVRVLGTKFIVRSVNDNRMWVDVERGKVEVYALSSNRNDTITTILTAGESVVVNNSTIKKVKQLPDAFFWVNKQLVFNKISLAEVFRILADRYDIRIDVTDNTINNLKLTSSFRADSAEEIVAIVAETFDLKYSVDKGVITVELSD
ncbi:MAG: FecR domain-containing protein [Bacteroidales bacterium]|jgi:ferric-dicitrate binding protein FerR (iron transport regulator)|nr:FecR domain-containing protein [Bacteroidales bacterium]